MRASCFLKQPLDDEIFNVDLVLTVMRTLYYSIECPHVRQLAISVCMIKLNAMDRHKCVGVE